MILRPLLISLAAASSLAAAPAWQADLTPAKPGGHAALAPSALDFQVTWKGLINSGKLHMEFAPPGVVKPGAVVVRSTAGSTGAAAKLFSYKHDFWCELIPGTLLPRYFHAVETDSKEKVTTSIRYLPAGTEMEETSVETKGGKSTTVTSTFAFAPVYDIFSAMLQIRSHPLAAGDHVNLVVQPFKTPYLLRVRSLGSEVHEGKKAIRLAIGMQKIDQDTLELRPYKKLRKEATLWLSDDADRVPLEFRAAVFIGDVRATLTKHQKY